MNGRLTRTFDVYPLLMGILCFSRLQIGPGNSSPFGIVL